MPTVNKRILDSTISHLVYLERYKRGTVNKILALLGKADDALAEDITKRLMKIKERGYDTGAMTTKRMNDLADAIKVKREEIYKILNEETALELNSLSKHETDFQAVAIEKAVSTAGVSIELLRPSTLQLNSIVNSRPFQGRLMREWYSDLSKISAKRMNDAIKIGIVNGQTTDQIVRRIVGSRAARYQDGIMAMDRRNAEAVVRTAITHVTNHAAKVLNDANSDIIDGYQWVSTLDGRTTPICQARDGKVYTGDSDPMPPAHWNCRSRIVPFLGSTSVKGTRASEIGQVPEDTTYETWLRKQPAERQDDILGSRKGKLFRDGGVSLDRFVDNSGKVYTLKELKVRDGAAWNHVFNND